MSILFYFDHDCDKQVESHLRQALLQRLPTETVIAWPDTDSPSDIDYAVVWGPPPDFFRNLTQLKAVFSLAAGVDHLLLHPGLPQHVPVVRLTDAGMGEKMAEYVLFGVLQAHRQMHLYRHFQQQRIWAGQLPSAAAKSVSIGILGIGILGQQVARRLTMNGYCVQGWSRSEKKVAHVITCSGASGLDQLIRQIDILVCLLPLTEETRGILNLDLFTRAKPGLHLINVARGGHLITADLIAALNSNQLGSALLDVTDPEPLPPEHPFWEHPRIFLTPHISAPTQQEESIRQIIDNLLRHQKGLPMLGVVDRTSGY